MRVPQRLCRHLFDWASAIIVSRDPDQWIGGDADPYLLRWYIIPRNRLFNIYLHQFRRSDDDSALHDHPWSNLSILLHGEYDEITLDWWESWWSGEPAYKATRRTAGEFKFRLPWKAHRLALVDGRICITLFVTGPKMRAWGFHCPKESPAGGWRHWKTFTKPGAPGEVGRGCE